MPDETCFGMTETKRFRSPTYAMRRLVCRSEPRTSMRAQRRTAACTVLAPDAHNLRCIILAHQHQCGIPIQFPLSTSLPESPMKSPGKGFNAIQRHPDHPDPSPRRPSHSHLNAPSIPLSAPTALRPPIACVKPLIPAFALFSILAWDQPVDACRARADS